MRSTRAFAQKLTSKVLIVFALLLAQNSHAANASGGNADAKDGVKKSEDLKGIGQQDLMIAIMAPVPLPIKIIMILNAMKEINGATEASDRNKIVDKKTSETGKTISGSAQRPDGGGGGGNPTPDTCAAGPEFCSCSNGSCKVVLPPIDDIKNALITIKTSEGENGKSLEDALSDVDTKYTEAQTELNKMNEVNIGGGSGGGAIAGGETLASGDPSEANGKKKAAATDKDDLVNGSLEHSGGDGLGGLNNNALSDIAKARGRPAAVTANGLNLVDATNGRVLTIFERTTRAIRGKNNRDIILAKLEYTRKSYLKRVQALSQPSEKKNIRKKGQPVVNIPEAIPVTVNLNNDL